MGLSKARAARLQTLNEKAPEHGRISFLEELPFGETLKLERYRLANGLSVLVVVDRSAPVVAYQTWFAVGSRNEGPGKTGLAHLFEHLMFNEVEGLKAGEFDTKMEAAGADNNASTWLDFTEYQESFPKDQLAVVIDLEARRMDRLVLRDPQVSSEKEVVANERRYRVEDDVDGATDELLWKTAFERHPYHWPTIGWMDDIEGFETADCRAFYETYYSPNNAALVVVGDVNVTRLLEHVSNAYGHIPAATLPIEDIQPEPPQTAERRVELVQPTPTEKVNLGYKGPALGDASHVVLSVLMEILVGGRASRLHRALVRTSEIATEVRGYVGPHRDPSLVEFFVNARGAHNAEELLASLDMELDQLLIAPPSDEEIARAVARAELGLLSGMETTEGKASSIGFYETVVGEPRAAFGRLREMRAVTRSQLLLAARAFLRREARTVVLVRCAGKDDATAPTNSGERNVG